MKKFSQFLVEENFFSKPVVEFTYITGTRPTEVYLKKIATAIGLPSEILKVVSRVDSREVKLILHVNSDIVLRDFRMTLYDKVEEIDPKCSIMSCRGITIRDRLDFKVDTTIKHINGLSSYSVRFQMTANSDIKSLAKNLTCAHIQLIRPHEYKGGVLSFLMIKELRGIIYTANKLKYDWVNFLNDSLEKDKDVLDCQEEMIKAGLKEFARL